jgi:RAB protein geranylgeranyltransferase component A
MALESDLIFILRDVEPDNNKDADTKTEENTAKLALDPSLENVGKDSDVMTATETAHVPELSSDMPETYEEQNASCDSNNDPQSCLETATGTKEETESNNASVVSNDVTKVTGSHENPECENNEECVDQSDATEVTGSNIGPECDEGQKEIVEKSEEDASEVHNVPIWAEKRKMKSAKKLDRNSTHKDFSEKSRKFNLDLSPKVLFSRGLLVESLISANISHYAEFKIVSRILTYMDGKIEEVPCSRSDVFGSELINVLEKRALMRFMTFCSTFEDCPEEYESFKDKPFIDFLKSRKLTTNLQHIVLNAIAGVPANTSTLSGLKSTQKFLRSLGRYGNTPFLWSLYGAGELPQAFCRMCAVFGGIYCLRKNVKSMVLDEDNKNCLAVIAEDGQRLNTKWLIMERSYVPEVFEIVTQCMTSRAILITDRSLKQASRECISILTIPTRSDGNPVRVIELAPSSMACPESLYVVHFTTETVVNASEDLNSYVEDLFTTPGKHSVQQYIVRRLFPNFPSTFLQRISEIFPTEQWKNSNL